jgi:hypothetical protein
MIGVPADQPLTRSVSWYAILTRRVRRPLQSPGTPRSALRADFLAPSPGETSSTLSGLNAPYTLDRLVDTFALMREQAIG